MAEVAQRYGPYTCVRRLGAGGMAETFLAVQHGSGGFEQRVCIKFMLAMYANNPAFRQMFLREATIAASLRHANIVGVIDVDEQAGYIVLELVDGVDLRRLLEAAPNRRLPPHIVSLVAIELCKALAYAHGRTRRGEPDGVVHRDISPANVLVAHHGSIKLTDFGVAKAMHSITEPASGGIKGKLCYMSPEQTRGERLDGRSDLFSLGVMLYELLASGRPFDGQSDAQTLLKIESGMHRPLVEVAPEVPAGLALVVERLLLRDTEQRYPNADACIDALARFAPPVTAYRELAQLARAAHPPETLSNVDLRPQRGSGPRRVYDYTDIPRTLANSDAYEPLDSALIPAAEVASSTRSVPSIPAPPETGFASRLARVSLGAWIALGGSLAAAALVLLAWTARPDRSIPRTILKPRTPASEFAEPRGAAKQGTQTGATQAQTSSPPSEDTGLAPGLAELVRPDLPPSQPPHEHAPQDTTPRDQARPGSLADQREHAQPDSPAQERERGPQGLAAEGGEQPLSLTPGRGALRSSDRLPGSGDGSAELRVGTVPLGQVWIDGEAAGWSPVVVKLSAGPHVVSGGNTEPTVKQSVRLHPNEKHRLVLYLEDDRSARDLRKSSVDR